MTMTMKSMIFQCAALTLCLVLASCGPTKEESWNSYYYGTQRVSTTYGDYPADNDDTYVPPQGSWRDNQTPQGMKWK